VYLVRHTLMQSVQLFHSERDRLLFIMVIDLKPLFSGRQDVITVDCELDLSHVEYGGIVPFPSSVRVCGSVCAGDTVHVGNVVTFVADVWYLRYNECSRCLTPFEGSEQLSLHVMLAEGSADGNNDDGAGDDESDVYTVFVPGFRLDIAELVTKELVLASPIKSLCRDDCKGLCLYCGKNLNDGQCGCRPDLTDFRLAALKELLD